MGLARQLLSLHGRYYPFFQRHTSTLAGRALQYLKGLFQADKKNMERMEEKVPETEYDPLQYFLSDSDWQYGPVNDQIGQDADKLLYGILIASFIDILKRFQDVIKIKAFLPKP